MADRSSVAPGELDFIGTALDRFHRAAEAESEVREDALDDLKFASGDQWPEGVKNARTQDSRPCLTVNRLPQVIQQITNEQRQQRPEMDVSPIGSGGDVETAEIIEGICRHIEQNSHEDVAVDTAFESMVRIGFGYWRYVTEYADPMSFDQEIKAKRILNPFTVYFDPACLEPDYSDANYAFIVEDMSVDEYKRCYPDSDLAGLSSFSSIGDSAQSWANDNGVRVAEYFYVETERTTICKLADGSVVEEAKLPKGAKVLAQREADLRKVKWAKINAVETLEERDWPGRWIPIIPVLGTELIVDEKRELVGIVRYAKDPQRMYNYWVSAQTEMIALAPKAPWMVAEGQIEGYEQQYRDANTRNLAVLNYKPKVIGGALLPPPQRQAVNPPIEAISVAIQQSAADLKAVTGLYDASLGAQSPDRSARAVLARQKEGDVANLHLSDNLTRSIKHAGRVKLDLIGKIYDGARIQRIIAPDGEAKSVPINQPFTDGEIQKIYDVSAGQYDVTITVGPSYASKRQDSVESMLQLVESCPSMLPIIGDLLVQNMDWPGAEAVADRLRKALPSEFQDGQDGQPAIPPQAQQQLSALGQQNQQLAARVHQLMDVIQQKKTECESRERIAAMNNQTALIQTEATINSQNAQLMVKAEIEALRNKFDVGATANLQIMAQAHEAALQHSQNQSELVQQQLQAKSQAGLQSQQQGADQAAQQQAQNHAVGMQNQKIGAAQVAQQNQLDADQQQQPEAA